MRERELEIGSDELSNVLTLDIIGVLNLGDLENVDRSKSSSVTSSQVLVESLNSGGTRKLTVLLVHVVSAGARIVTDPDAEVLDLGGGLLVDQVDGDDLTSSLLDSSKLGQEVPESRLSNNSVGSKDSHAVELWLRL